MIGQTCLRTGAFCRGPVFHPFMVGISHDHACAVEAVALSHKEHHHKENGTCNHFCWLSIIDEERVSLTSEFGMNDRHDKTTKGTRRNERFTPYLQLENADVEMIEVKWLESEADSYDRRLMQPNRNIDWNKNKID